LSRVSDDSWELQHCYKCKAVAELPTGVIYVRAKNDKDEWDSLPICAGCWNIENPTKQVKGLTASVEMSGFPISYENVCQSALWAGIQWMSGHGITEEEWKGSAGFKNVYGILDTPESIQPLEDIWRKMEQLKGWTGAQHQAVCGHLIRISKIGVDGWRKEMFEKAPERVIYVDVKKLTEGVVI
jgi:hypothetical protein